MKVQVYFAIAVASLLIIFLVASRIEIIEAQVSELARHPKSYDGRYVSTWGYCTQKPLTAQGMSLIQIADCDEEIWLIVPDPEFGVEEGVGIWAVGEFRKEHQIGRLLVPNAVLVQDGVIEVHPARRREFDCK